MQILRRSFYLAILASVLLACQSSSLQSTEVTHVDDVHTEDPSSMPAQNGSPDQPALSNDSGIEGVETYPDKFEYHDHVETVPEADGTIPPPFGAHLRAWQNCGIYDQPVGLGNALHSMEHGAVWLTYGPGLSTEQIAELQGLVRGHGFVLMSPYPAQVEPVVLTAWGVQLVIESLPDERIARFIDYYENGPQNPEPGAPCSGAVGNPIH